MILKMKELEKMKSEGDLHFLVKKKVGEALGELGYDVEYEKHVDEGKIDVHGNLNGNEINVEVMHSHAPNWILLKVTGNLNPHSKTWKTINVSDEVHKKLGKLCPKTLTFSEYIDELIKVFEK